MIFKFASVRIFLTAIEKALNDINLTTRLLSWLGQAKAIIKVLIFEQLPHNTLTRRCFLSGASLLYFARLIK